MKAAGTHTSGKPQWADTAPMAEERAPALWNPAAAANWSLLFTPVFGAALHMKNWRALGDADKAAQAKVWMIATLVIMICLMTAGMVLPESKEFDSMARSAGIGLLFGWYFTAARAQQKLVKERFGGAYERKGWLKPIGLAVLALSGLFVVMIVIALLAGA